MKPTQPFKLKRKGKAPIYGTRSALMVKQAKIGGVVVENNKFKWIKKGR